VAAERVELDAVARRQHEHLPYVLAELSEHLGE
jgi:hypothetical protein